MYNARATCMKAEENIMRNRKHICALDMLYTICKYIINMSYEINKVET